MKVKISSPSNIAFIKYWGKSDPKLQWPTNDSLSMTLKNCVSITECEAIDSEEDLVILDGKIILKEDSKHKKIFSHIQFIRDSFKYEGKFKIDTYNTFPKSSGIASSASGMSALTIALFLSITKINIKQFNELTKEELNLLSNLSRLGSGSACRSVLGGYVKWNRGMSPYNQSCQSLLNSEHWALKDTILIPTKEEKLVSSTDGHKKARESILFEPRISVLPERTKKCVSYIENKDIRSLGEILENEALEIHSVVMTSNEPICYLNNTSIEIISSLRKERSNGNINAYFTIDAGSTIHIISEEKELNAVKDFIKHYNFKLSDIVYDEVGEGPEILENYYGK